MPDNPLRFYLDEQMPLVIARQVRRLGIEVVTARDLNALGDSDENHLKRAADMGYVLCTLDDDFLALAAAGSQHAGIVYGICGNPYHWRLGAFFGIDARRLRI